MKLRRKLTQKLRRRLAPGTRQAELLAAAIRLMREGGDSSPRIADVTRAARAAKGTFYRYFENREELLLGVREERSQVMRRGIFGPLAAATRAGETPALASVLASAGTSFVESVVGLGALHAAIFHGPWREEGGMRPEVSMLRELLVSGDADGGDLDVAAELLFGAWHAAADAIARGEDRTRYLDGLSLLTGRWFPPPKGSHGQRKSRVSRARR